MLYHIILGFIIPWIFGVYLYKKHMKLMVLFFPIGSVIAFLINDLGVNFFWRFEPSLVNISLAGMPYDLGFYPIASVFFIIIIHHNKLNLKTALFVFVLGTTLLEFITVMQNKVFYRNGWNTFGTACSYLISYFMVFVYYQLLRELKVIEKT